MIFRGKKSWVFMGYEATKVIEWLTPVALTAAVTYASTWIAYLKAAGGWREVLSFVLVMVGRVAYQWVKDNTGKKT